MSVLVTYNTLTFHKDSTAFVKEFASVIIALREVTALAAVLLIIPPIPSTGPLTRGKEVPVNF